MNTIDILIPTYNRQKIFGRTLDSIACTILDRYNFDFEVNVRVGILDTNPTEAIRECDRVYEDTGLDADYIAYRDNIGKARCLNDMVRRLNRAEWVITLDNDMTFNENWLHIVDAAIHLRKSLKWNYVGFGGKNHFIHLPDKIEETNTYLFPHNDRKYYVSAPYGIGGGMLLFHNDFLSHYIWKNNGGGVYLGDDARLSAYTKDKFVIYYDADWISHDKYAALYPEYQKYYNRKMQQIISGNEVYQKGWDK